MLLSAQMKPDGHWLAMELIRKPGYLSLTVLEGQFICKSGLT